MTNTAIRAGGAPVQSTVLVSVDGTTIQGNGSARDPLRAVGQSDPVLERVTATNVQHGDVSGTVPLSLCGGLAAGLKQFDLADGEVDGFQKTIALLDVADDSPGLTYRINLTLSTFSGHTQINFGPTGGGAVLVWDADNGWWDVVATAGTIA